VTEPFFRLKLLINQPIPYNIDLLNAVAAHAQIELSVLYLTERESIGNQKFINYPTQNYQHKVLKGIQLGHYWFNPGVVAELARSDYDFFWLAGYDHPTLALALEWLSATSKRFITWADTFAPADPYSKTLRILKHKFQNQMFKKACAVMMTGRAGVESAIKRGCPTERVVELPYFVDPNRALNVSNKIKERANAIRKEAGGRPVILFVGQLIKRKGLDTLIEAAENLKFTAYDPCLIFAGTGPMMDDLTIKCSEFNLKAMFPGFIQFDELPAFFMASDMLVLPSRWDPWPLVVLEAMVWGVPVIASNACGSARDRVVTGENGYIVPVDDANELARAIRCLIDNPDLRQLMRVNARRTAMSWPPERGAEIIYNALRNSLCRAGS
jgi:glycosyltransferase involved in cell wall biosynthesis